MAKQKKYVVQTDNEKKQEVIDSVLNFFEKNDKIDTKKYHIFADLNQNADIVGYLFVQRQTLHVWNHEGFTPYEEKKQEKFAKLFFIDIADPLDFGKILTEGQQVYLEKKRICNEYGIVYILNNDSDAIIEEILKLK